MTATKRPGLRARSDSVAAAMKAAGTASGEQTPAPAAAPAVPAPAAPAEKAKLVGLTVRLDQAKHDQLREIAFHERVSIHSLLVEGIDLVLKKRARKG